MATGQPDDTLREQQAGLFGFVFFQKKERTNITHYFHFTQVSALWHTAVCLRHSYTPQAGHPALGGGKKKYLLAPVIYTTELSTTI